MHLFYIIKSTLKNYSNKEWKVTKLKYSFPLNFENQTPNSRGDIKHFIEFVFYSIKYIISENIGPYNNNIQNFNLTLCKTEIKLHESISRFSAA